MLLFVGLGNPGKSYRSHRHNVGFMAVDAIADEFGFPAFRNRFRSELAEGVIGGEKVLILKPQTYMNKSGEAVREVAAFYKLPLENIVVFYDEIDLAPGKVRVRTGGGTAGHNGIRSLVAHLGEAFRRVRIGVGHPGHKDLVHGYVLSGFSKAEQKWLDPLLKAMSKAAPHLAASDDPRFMSEVALSMQKEGFAPKDTPDGL